MLTNVADGGNTFDDAVAIALPVSFEQSVGGSGDPIDYFVFTPETDDTISVSLTGLTADVDLHLFDPAGLRVAQSRTDGTEDESFTYDVVGGQQYILGISAETTANATYTVDISLDSSDGDTSDGGDPNGGDSGSGVGDSGEDDNGDGLAAGGGNGSGGEEDPPTSGSLQAVEDGGNTIAEPELIQIPVNFTQSVGGPDDTDDYYQIEANENGTLVVSLTGLTADVDLHLYNAAGIRIASSRNAGTADEEFTFEVEAGVNYVLGVSPNTSANSPYRVTMTLNGEEGYDADLVDDDGFDDSLVPDDGSDDGGSDGAGNIPGSVVSPPEGGGDGSGVVDGSTGDTADNGDATGSGNDGAGDVPGTVVSPPEGGGDGSGMADGSTGDTGGNGDAIGGGGIVTVDGSNFIQAPVNFSQSVGGPSDTDDSYQIQIPESGTLVVSLTGLTADVDLHLYDAAGNRLADSRNSGAADEEFEFEVEAGVNYVLGVTPVTSENSPYQISMSLNGQSGPDVEVSDQDGFGDGGEDDGDEPSEPHDLLAPFNFSQSLGGFGDMDDFFQFTASADGTLEITLSGLTADVGLFLYSASGQELALSINEGTADERITFDVIAGTNYVLGVQAETTEDTPYQVSMVLDGATGTDEGELEETGDGFPATSTSAQQAAYSIAPAQDNDDTKVVDESAFG